MADSRGRESMDQGQSEHINTGLSDILREYGDYIYRCIRFRVKDSTQWDDVYQEFSLSLLNQPVPQNIKDIKGYLYRRIMCLTVDQYRKQAAYHALLKKKAKMEPSATPVEETTEYQEEIRNLFSMIEERLDGREARVILSRHRDHRDVQETARVLGIKDRSVSRYYSSGIKKLKQLVRLNGGQDS